MSCYKTLFIRVLIFISALCTFTLKAQSYISSPDSFEIGEKEFLLNGETFVVKAAELHYPRIPEPYWDQRIKMCKALGMNTVCLYTFWNVHEEREDVFDFSGNKDIRRFINLCKENDMKVILRPGPYVCAEWEMGGLPWWLLKKKDIKLRDSDPYFMERVRIFETQLAEQVKDLTIENGGPIIMIQVENEYGAYGENKPYVSEIRDVLKGLYGENVVMFQCDWSSNFTLNGLDDLVWTMNFGTGADIDSQFSPLQSSRPNAPLMCSEFWSGWFDKWGAAHETRPATEMIKGIETMLSKDISFSLYMTHGGTNWGHWAGANSPGYAPDVTSYDYDAPINESGNPTPKYWLLRDLLERYSGKDSLPSLPGLIQPITVDTFTFTEIAPLWENLPQSVFSETIKPMEFYDQGYGSIMYTSELPDLPEGIVLNVIEPHDYAQVFIDGNLIGVLDRRLGETQIVLPLCKKGQRLDILVEAMGRINFGVAIKDYKGITENVFLSQSDSESNIPLLDSWNVNLIPDSLEFYNSWTYHSLDTVKKGDNGRYPRGIYRGSFHVDKPSDTFLLFETWGKGLVYVNGHALGRIWNIGPQQTLYTPGCWLKEGENEILVFDIMGPEKFVSQGLETPILDKLQYTDQKYYEIESGDLEVGNLTPVYGGAFPQGNGWKRQIFETPQAGRYIVIEILGTHDSEPPAISEFYALNEKGERISRESWSVAYADSEDNVSGNHLADRIFDLQESTYWQPGHNYSYPQLLIINMGKTENISGIEYLPRVESGSPGAINEYKVYILKSLK